MDFKKINDCAQKIDGWLTPKEGKLLYDLSKKNDKGVIVEIGSWKGKSTTYLGLGSKKGKKNKIYAIDPHIGSLEHRKNGKIWTFEEFKKNIKKSKISDIIIPLVKTSEEAAKYFDKKIGVLFIDGDHSYKNVKNDFNKYFNKVEEGGYIAFHDVFNCIYNGPTFFMLKQIFFNKNITDIKFVDSIGYFKKSNKKINSKEYKENISRFLKKSLSQKKYYLNRKRIPLSIREKILNIFKKN